MYQSQTHCTLLGLSSMRLLQRAAAVPWLTCKLVLEQIPDADKGSPNSRDSKHDAQNHTAPARNLAFNIGHIFTHIPQFFHQLLVLGFQYGNALALTVSHGLTPFRRPLPQPSSGFPRPRRNRHRAAAPAAPSLHRRPMTKKDTAAGAVFATILHILFCLLQTK